IRLVPVESIDVDTGDVDVRSAVDDPLRYRASNATAGQDANGVQAGRDEVVLDFRRFADDWQQIRCEALGAAEELTHACFERHGYARHRLLQVRRHPVPVRWQLAEREVLRDSVDLPRRTDRLEEPDHQAGPFLAEVPVARRILEYGQIAVHAVDRLG